MNQNIKKLFQIADKDTRLIIGLMSGTSLDGLDIALCEFTGSGMSGTAKVLNFKTADYSNAFREQVRSVFSRRDADLQTVTILNALIATTHAELINSALADWNIDPASVDLIASHGQTIFHAPRSFHGNETLPNATLQIGDGDHIAVKTGIITLSDFRQKHIAAGGEGAPLAVYGDYLLFSKPGADRILLNIGGIANFTFLPGDDRPHAIFSTDVGPGNTMMDHYMAANFGRFYDKDAEIASAGKVLPDLLTVLLDNPFFTAPFPKTTGPELFSMQYLARALESAGLNRAAPEDVMATLCKFSARAIIEAIGDKPYDIFMSGGGMHNPLLVADLKDGLPNSNFYTTGSLGIAPDAKEAVLFAVLANEAVAGMPVDLGNRAGIPAVSMGKISFPK